MLGLTASGDVTAIPSMPSARMMSTIPRPAATAQPHRFSQVLDIHWQGNNLMGAIEVLPTPAGKILIDLFKSGCQVGVSSRGWASLREQNGCITIQDDFELIT